MAPSGEHRPEDLGYSAVHAAAVATSNGAIALRKQVSELHTNGAGKTVATRCETLTAQAVAAEKLAAKLAATAKALKLREDAAKAWNKNAPKDSEIKAAEEAVTAAKKKLQDASAASGDTSAASKELEAAQKTLGELRRKRREADKAYDKAEEKANLELAKIAPEDTSADSDTGTPAPGTSNSGTPAPSTGSGSPSAGTPSKTGTGTAKPSATPAGTPSPSSAMPSSTETNSATPESVAALAALLGQQQQPQAQAQQAQPTAAQATPTATTPQAPQNSQPTQDKKKETGTSPLDRILGSDGILDNAELTGLIGAPLTLGGGSAPTSSTPSAPAAAVTPSAPAPAAPSTTGLSAGTVTQPVTSGTSATGLNTNTDVSGRAGEARNAFSPTGPETKTSSATGTGTSAAPAHAAGTRPMGGGMPIMPPVAGMGGPAGGAGRTDKDREPTTLASGSEESYYLHGRQAVDSAVPGGTIAQRDHPRRRPDENAA